MAITSRKEVSRRYCVFCPLAVEPAPWTLSMTTFSNVPMAPTVAYPRASAAARRISSCELSSCLSKVSQKPEVDERSMYLPVSPRANRASSHCCTPSGVGADGLSCIATRKCRMAPVCTSLADDETTAARPLASVPMTWRCACACALAKKEVSLSSWRSLSKGQWARCCATRDRKWRMESRAPPCRSGDRHTFKTAGTHFSITAGAMDGAVSRISPATWTHSSVM
mmetsp:Transcript_128978/g.223801  ORF Transcript_128978/g.223801 Transcript_128978/m.223801 type:complete len:225 (-) Transcript_128978:2290-2964(-)